MVHVPVHLPEGVHALGDGVPPLLGDGDAVAAGVLLVGAAFHIALPLQHLQRGGHSGRRTVELIGQLLLGGGAGRVVGVAGQRPQKPGRAHVPHAPPGQRRHAGVMVGAHELLEQNPGLVGHKIPSQIVRVRMISARIILTGRREKSRGAAVNSL